MEGNFFFLDFAGLKISLVCPLLDCNFGWILNSIQEIIYTQNFEGTFPLSFSVQCCYTEVNSLWPAIIVHNFFF